MDTQLIQLKTIVDWLLEWILSTFAYVIVILVGVEILTPRVWNLIESVWWRIKLGNSSLGRELRLIAKEDFKHMLDHKVKELSTPRSLAVLLTIPERLVQLKRLNVTLKRRHAEMCAERFESMIEELNRLWRNGSNPPYLQDYVKEIETSACYKGIDAELRLWGLSVISVIKYALGFVPDGHRLGRDNWRYAQQLESVRDSEQKWLASYGYFFSTLFLGRCKHAIDLMSGQWSAYYAPLDHEESVRLRKRLSGKLILNPILAIPRHMFLAFALADIMPRERHHWPTAKAFDNAWLEDPHLKLRWFESWYNVAQDICPIEPLSMSFTRSYSGFFLTLLLLESNTRSSILHERIKEVFGNGEESGAIVAKYGRFGFSGVYHLVCGNNERALDDLNNAASFSAISGNRFADCIFLCALAVAAARLNRSNRYLTPQINRHLTNARRIADTIKSDLFTRLCDAAESAVCLHRGEKIRALQFAERSRAGRPDSRVLKIFDDDALDTPNRRFPNLKLTA